ncbi:hypothetical protein [Nitrosomonas sp. ANs5]|uniref:hypothetical protein n=1 Tax=Nitrosomonas sp. ANs5 TaxID=3423941 RepID=UPI003D330F7F
MVRCTGAPYSGRCAGCWVVVDQVPAIMVAIARKTAIRGIVSADRRIGGSADRCTGALYGEWKGSGFEGGGVR